MPKIEKPQKRGNFLFGRHGYLIYDLVDIFVDLICLMWKQISDKKLSLFFKIKTPSQGRTAHHQSLLYH
jgi:hypothetical protein